MIWSIKSLEVNLNTSLIVVYNRWYIALFRLYLWEIRIASLQRWNKTNVFIWNIDDLMGNVDIVDDVLPECTQFWGIFISTAINEAISIMCISQGVFLSSGYCIVVSIDQIMNDNIWNDLYCYCNRKCDFSSIAGIAEVIVSILRLRIDDK